MAAARTLLDAVREHDPAAGELADRVAEITYLLSDVAADVASYADGLETVVHEYGLRAAVDRRTKCLLRIDGKPGPLPYVECPGAAASAQRLVGRPLEGLRDHVSATFTGPSTCTHLNDALRGLEDLDMLTEEQR